ncbi:hypothetical protein ASPZODRAFT_1482827 [Penicilliopsis zonata CBS 506.65]|uniref:Uncharacterized protein n=1 Tax=Penicilliopsis zonata CBS 506.65 TaxID=1073090 RepID=A0A1L9SQP9_9EURO|nr:hypothetical protein ASPZODRAFT_1482827 [Penicilliopsis zonata CBS 506.65]OJJ49446.1 hypothetical protein ASPZODRAFT_1482827 [Penicilliopsis zonata CBS 506.65]
MNITGLHDSLSSYGESSYLPSTAFAGPAKLGLGDYQTASEPGNEETLPYNALNPVHSRSSAVPDANDPIVMYLLTENAIGDSRNYEILSIDDVESLKKEHVFLTSRVESTRRKLALETKLRDAARSLSRLHQPKSIHHNDPGYENGGSPGYDTSESTDEELNLSIRKCEDLAQELSKLERRKHDTHQRLLEHTAGILQLTHKGLKKNLKNGMPRTPESIYSNTRGSAYGFDNRSMYKAPENLEDFGPNSKRALENSSSLNSLQSTERRLEELSARVRDMVTQANSPDEIQLFPQSSSNGGPVNPTASIEAHLAYIESCLASLSPYQAGGGGSDPNNIPHHTVEGLHEINARLHHVLAESGLSRSPTIPPPPEPMEGGLQEQLSYANTGVDSLQNRIDGLLEQKSILTTQIQQQRELNSKSDAERDAHIADLVEQLSLARKDLELSDREHQATRDELSLVMEQFDSVRQEMTLEDQKRSSKDSSALNSEREARAKAESDISRLESLLEQLQVETRAHTEEATEARARAEEELAHMEATLEEVRTDAESRVVEATALRAEAEDEISRLQAALEQVQSESDAQLREAVDARVRAEQELAHLEATLEDVRAHSDSHAVEATTLQAQAEEVSRLQAALEQVHSETDARLKEATEARARAEEELAHMEATLEEVRADADSRTVEATTLRAEAEGEVSRLQAALEQAHSETDAQLKEALEARARAEQELAQMEATLEEVRADADSHAVEATALRAQAEGEVSRLQAALEQAQAETGDQLKEAIEARDLAEEKANRLQAELTELEGEIVRAQTELTVVKAELDGAYGTRAQRAAEVAANPAIQMEIDYLNTRNLELTEELATLRGRSDVNSDLQQRVELLEKELRETLDDYEVMTKSSIEFEKEREGFESIIDGLRDRCESLETQLSEERINGMGLHSPATSVGRDGPSETTSTMVLKNEFKKMMRDTRSENIRILKNVDDSRHWFAV